MDDRLERNSGAEKRWEASPPGLDAKRLLAPTGAAMVQPVSAGLEGVSAEAGGLNHRLYMVLGPHLTI